MTTFLISPAERPPITNLGTNSALPERMGVDILWESKHGLVGVQRKEVFDLVASVRDGRLGREIEQMKASLKFAFVVIEGQPSWDREGNLVTQHTRWDLRQHNGTLLSIQTQGILVLHSRNQLETCSLIEYLAEWSERDAHVSTLLARPSAQKNGWGRLDQRETAIHVYTGIPGVNTVLATRIYDAGIRLLVCGTTEEELTSVRGIGKKTASDIMRAIGNHDDRTGVGKGVN